MYINFQQNRANRSVITVHTNVFAKKKDGTNEMQKDQIWATKIQVHCINKEWQGEIKQSYSYNYRNV